MHLYIDEGNDVTVETRDCDNSTCGIRGSGNRVHIRAKSKLNNLHIKINGNQNILELGKNIIINKSAEINVLDDGNYVGIGNGCFFEAPINMLVRESTQLTIGDNCLFSWGIDIRTSDQHSIFDQATNIRINKAKNIYIGNHVWICSHVTLLKGTVVKDNSVIGTKSVVSRAFHDGNVVIAGNPAEIKKENINWDRKRV